LDFNEHDFVEDNYIEKREMQLHFLWLNYGVCVCLIIWFKSNYLHCWSTLEPIRYFNKVFLTCDSIERYWSTKAWGSTMDITSLKIVERKRWQLISHVFFLLFLLFNGTISTISVHIATMHLIVYVVRNEG
jgi:hypothetical protein